jgi:hypothetical protein
MSGQAFLQNNFNFGIDQTTINSWASIRSSSDSYDRNGRFYQAEVPTSAAGPSQDSCTKHYITSLITQEMGPPAIKPAAGG